MSEYEPAPPPRQRPDEDEAFDRWRDENPDEWEEILGRKPIQNVTLLDHRVVADDARAARVMAGLQDGEAVCIECGGTGNEFLFMYRACQQCQGTGKVRDA